MDEEEDDDGRRNAVELVTQTAMAAGGVQRDAKRDEKRGGARVKVLRFESSVERGDNGGEVARGREDDEEEASRAQVNSQWSTQRGRAGSIAEAKVSIKQKPSKSQHAPAATAAAAASTSTTVATTTPPSTTQPRQTAGVAELEELEGEEELKRWQATSSTV